MAKRRGASIAAVTGAYLVALLLFATPASAANPHPDKGKSDDHGNKHDEPPAPAAETPSAPPAENPVTENPAPDAGATAPAAPETAGATAPESDGVGGSAGAASANRDGDHKGKKPDGAKASKASKTSKATKTSTGSKANKPAKSKKAKKAPKPRKDKKAHERPAAASRGHGNKKGHGTGALTPSARAERRAGAKQLPSVMEQVLGLRLTKSTGRGATRAAGSVLGGGISPADDALPFTGGDVAAFLFIGMMVVTVGGLIWRAPSLIDPQGRTTS